MSILFIATLFIIRSDINLLMFSRFLPMKIREWRPTSDVEYKNGTQPGS